MSRKGIVQILQAICILLLFEFSTRYISNRYALSDYGPDALYHAITTGHTDTVDTLLRLGASPNKFRTKNGLPLYVAVASDPARRAAVVDVLLKHGAAPNRKVPFGDSTLASAAKIGDSVMVRLLIDSGARIGPLEAAYMRDYAAMDRLFRNDSEAIGTRHARNRTLLMQATELGDVQLIQYLLKKGANPNLGDERDNTALHLAMKLPNAPSVLEQLLAEGADPAIPNNKSMLPLHLCRYTNPERVDTCVEILLSVGSPLGAVDRTGRTPIFEIVRVASPEIVDLALGLGAKLDQRDSEQFTPIFFASAKNIPTLIAAGADPNAIGLQPPGMGKPFPVTPLHYALFDYWPRHPKDVVPDLPKLDALLAGGAQPDLAGKGGTSALGSIRKYTENWHGASGDKYRYAQRRMENSLLYTRTPDSVVAR